MKRTGIVIALGALALGVLSLTPAINASAHRAAAPAAARFSTPYGVTLDRAGNVYVVDSGKYQVIKLSPKGAVLEHFGTKGKKAGQFDDPHQIAVDLHGAIYVTDYGADRVEKFSAGGKFLAAWRGNFFAAQGIAVDSAGHLYVGTGDGVVKATSNGKKLAAFAVKGAGLTHGVALDAHGHIYASDWTGHITKLSSSGHFLAQWGKDGDGIGQLSFPEALTVDRTGNVYVADSENNRVSVFSANGKLLREIGSQGGGSTPGQFFGPDGVAIGPDGNLYVADTNNNRVQKLTLTGKSLAVWP